MDCQSVVCISSSSLNIFWVHNHQTLCVPHSLLLSDIYLPAYRMNMRVMYSNIHEWIWRGVVFIKNMPSSITECGIHPCGKFFSMTIDIYTYRDWKRITCTHPCSTFWRELSILRLFDTTSCPLLSEFGTVFREVRGAER